MEPPPTVSPGDAVTRLTAVPLVPRAPTSNGELVPLTSLHFNGGINLPDVDTVLHALGELPHRYLRRVTDGETGERRKWIGYQVGALLGAGGLRPVDAEPDGGEYGAAPVVRLADGVSAERIDWPDLGYATVYLESYARFRELRATGVLPAHVRFQAQYPTPEAVSNLFHPQDRQEILTSYRRALLADLERLVDGVDHGDLAVQWDAAVETVMAEMHPDRRQAIGNRLRALVERVPTGVQAGIHLCHGDAGHEAMFQPRSLANQVLLARAVLVDAARPVDWLSFTVPPDRTDEAFFAPLQDLDAPLPTEIYLSLVPYHPDEQPEGTRDAQAAVVDRLLNSRPWGICTPCGMGRVDRDDVLGLIALHQEILDKHTTAAGPTGAESAA